MKNLRGIIAIIALLIFAVHSIESNQAIIQEQESAEAAPVITSKAKSAGIKTADKIKTKPARVAKRIAPTSTNESQLQISEDLLKSFEAGFYQSFGRMQYRDSVRKRSQMGGSEFAYKVSDSLQELEALQLAGKISVIQFAEFLKDCAAEQPSELPSFVQALCLRKLEKYSYYRGDARKMLEAAKQESHPAVKDLFGILSRKED